jgi:hypothetical protein
MRFNEESPACFGWAFFLLPDSILAGRERRTGTFMEDYLLYFVINRGETA